MSKKLSTSGKNDGMFVKAYRGDGAVLLAMDLEKKLVSEDFAGFAIQCTPSKGKPFYISNRLNFTTKVTKETKPKERVWTPSAQAPFQKFRWVHFPDKLQGGSYSYEVSPMYFQKSGGLKQGPAASVSLDIMDDSYSKFEMGFTRGYLSSQAYAATFKNAEIRPPKKTLDFNTARYAKQYEWLGYHARKMVFSFLNECLENADITVDVFAYDIDEPDFVKGLEQLGKRLRIFLDDASLHTKPGALEKTVKSRLEKSAGKQNVKTGHFRRFAHNKVMIQKKNGTPVKVLTGSANFSLRGLYVQANNVLIFDDPSVAALYEKAFEQAFTDMSGFARSDIAAGWKDISGSGLPPSEVAFSPHKDPSVSLDKVAEAIKKADSSVLFAIMELGGSGSVLDCIKDLGGSKKLFSYGVTQASKGLKLYKPGESSGIFASFDYLKDKVPAPFQKEWSGGPGQVIHHKFLVIDFNSSDPVVYTGSSNLAAGGEKANGDNLIEIRDLETATAYAVEAVRLVDHYHFRMNMKKATVNKPLTLRPDGKDKKKWWQPYYDPRDIKYKERMLFIHP